MIEIFKYDDITLGVTPIEADPDRTRTEREHAAVRAIIARFFGVDARIGHSDTGAPYLVGREDISLTVSHSRDYAAVAFSSERTIGVDIEQWREQLLRVAPRVLSESEMAVYGVSSDLLLRAWTMKEALYKAALTPGLDFRRDITLPSHPASTAATVAGRPYTIIATLTIAPDTLTLVAEDKGQSSI